MKINADDRRMREAAGGMHVVATLSIELVIELFSKIEISTARRSFLPVFW